VEPAPSAAVLLERARALALVFAAEAAESERLRRPTDAAIEALRRSDIPRMLVASGYGGPELDADAFVEVGLALGEGDASLAWISTFYIMHNWMLCLFPEPFQKEILGRHGYVLAPAPVAPNGVAQPVEGGFRLNGRWQWGTGVMHADWVLVGARVPGAGPMPDFRFLALPRAEITVEDTWFVDGMCGTGSNDVRVDDAFVPEVRCVSMLAMSQGRTEGARLHRGGIYRTPMLPLLSLAAALPLVGQARAVVRGFQASMRERILYGSMQKQADKPAAQIRLARAEIEVRQAEELLRAVAAEIMALRDGASIADRARWTAMNAMAVDQSKRVIASLAEASGASAHFLSHPLQRALRDVNTGACHVVFDLDARLEMHGRTLLGLDPGGMT